MDSGFRRNDEKVVEVEEVRGDGVGGVRRVDSVRTQCYLYRYFKRASDLEARPVDAGFYSGLSPNFYL